MQRARLEQGCKELKILLVIAAACPLEDGPGTQTTDGHVIWCQLKIPQLPASLHIKDVQDQLGGVPRVLWLLSAECDQVLLAWTPLR